MTLQRFFNLYNGKHVDYDHVFGHQCKDLFSYYNQEVVENPDYVKGDAWELYDNCPATYYKKVDIPERGDVAIWEKSFGGYGHVAIVWDSTRFFSQNYPIGSVCQLISIPTTKIKGYLRPLTPLRMKYDAINQAFMDKFTKIDEAKVIPYVTKKPDGTPQYNLIRKDKNGNITEKLDISQNEYMANLSIWY